MRPGSCAVIAGLVSIACVLACAGFPAAQSPPAEGGAAIVFDAEESNTTSTYLTLAALREDAADWSGALTRVDKALIRQPRSRSALLRRAELLLLSAPDADHDEAREILAAAEADDAEALVAQGLLAAADGDTATAVARAQQAADAGGDAPRIQWLAARLLVLHGDAHAALPLAEQAFELDPKSGAARRERARARLRSGDFDGAQQDLGAQLRTHPDDVESRVIQADLLRRIGADALALDALDAIAPDHRGADAQALRGRLELELGKPDLARATLEPAAAAHPTHANVEGALCTLDLRERRAAECADRLDAALAAAPEDAALARIRATALAAADRRQEAAAAFTRAIAIDPDATESYEVLVRWIGTASDGEARIAALGLGPASTDVAIGMLREARGDHAGAIASHERALAANPASAIARASLARALAVQGRSLDRATTLAREARAARPNDPDFAWALGLAHLRRGQAKSAIESLGGAAGSYPVERPGFPELIWDAAQALERAGDRSAAGHTADMAIALAKHHGLEDAAWVASARAMSARAAPTKRAASAATTAAPSKQRAAADDASAAPAAAPADGAQTNQVAPADTTPPATPPTPPPAPVTR